MSTPLYLHRKSQDLLPCIFVIEPAHT